MCKTSYDKPINSVLQDIIDPNLQLRVNSGLITSKIIKKAQNNSELMIKLKKGNQMAKQLIQRSSS